MTWPTQSLSPEREAALAALREVFAQGDLKYTEISPTSLMVELPGEKKLQTPCRFDVGKHALRCTRSCAASLTRTSRASTGGCWSAT